MAVLALHRGVSAEKREAILVILNLLNGIVPTKNGVAPRAVRAHFPLVTCGGVAILAGNGKRSVRTTSGLPLRCGCARCRPREEQQTTQDLNELRRNSLPCFSFPKSVSAGLVEVCHDDRSPSCYIVPCAGSRTTVPRSRFWPGAILGQISTTTAGTFVPFLYGRNPSAGAAEQRTALKVR